MIKLIKSVVFGFTLLAASALAQQRGDGSGNSKTILVLGDSLSAAYNMSVEQGWVALLEDSSELKSKKYTVINASVSGATTAAGLQLLPHLLKQYKPSVVVIELGANDGLQGKPLNYIRRNLETLITLSKKQGAVVLLLGVRIPPNYGDAYALPFFKQFDELAEIHNLAFVPFFLEGVATDPSLMMDDGLHPKPEAQPQILRNVLPSLLPLLE